MSPERRALPRNRCRASFCRVMGGIPLEVTVRDISSAGIGLLCDGPVQPGEVLNLHLSGRGVRLAVMLPVRVVHAGERPDGRWLVGCAIEPPLPKALASALSSPT
jgi:PilZ domain